ncbi:MAG: NrfD/PsrC family molybdoenzyme membrane anchor subunit [Raoultibacter sp.]
MFDNLIIGYLFLGGAGAGMILILSLLDFVANFSWKCPSQRRNAWKSELYRAFFARGYVFAVLLISFGALCLLIDTGHPERFFYVLLYPTMSVLTFGSYVLVGALVCAAVLGAISWLNLVWVPRRVIKVVEIASVVFGLATMLYTGVFLMEIDFIPLWNNAFLPMLFVLSALSVAVGCLLCCLVFFVNDYRCDSLLRMMSRLDMIFIVAEGVCLVAYLIFACVMLNATDLVFELVFGVNALVFWVGFVVCGLVLPFILGVAYTKMNDIRLLEAAIPLVLIGGFALRYCVVNVPCM